MYFENSSNGILPSPCGARFGAAGKKCAAPPRTLTISSFSLAEYKFERAEHAQNCSFRKEEARQRSEDMAGGIQRISALALWFRRTKMSVAMIPLPRNM